MTSELESAIANAARVFSRYALNGRIIVCNCNSCLATEIERELICTPLHVLSSSLLGGIHQLGTQLGRTRLEAACLKETDEMTAELFSQAEGLVARNA
jgi:hypothetical protein